MSTNEMRMEFINLLFKQNLIATMQASTNLGLLKGDLFILSMSWPWRAPDKSEFNCTYAIPANEVVKQGPPLQLVGTGKFGIAPSQQLQLWTIPKGDSTIRFSLIYFDVNNNNSPIASVIKAIGKECQKYGRQE